MFEIRYENSDGMQHRNRVCGDFLGRTLPALAEEWARGDIGNLCVYNRAGQMVNDQYGLSEYKHATTIEPLDSRPEDIYGEWETLNQSGGTDEPDMAYEGQDKYYDAA